MYGSTVTPEREELQPSLCLFTNTSQVTPTKEHEKHPNAPDEAFRIIMNVLGNSLKGTSNQP